MFLIGDGPERHAKQIRSWLNSHPSVALVIAAVYFEWTLCRVIIGLSVDIKPNEPVGKRSVADRVDRIAPFANMNFESKTREGGWWCCGAGVRRARSDVSSPPGLRRENGRSAPAR